MTHGWIIPTPRRHKIAKINAIINFLIGKVCGTRTHTTFTITITKTNWRINIIWINPTKWLLYWRWCSLMLRRKKLQIMPVSEKNIFLGGQVDFTSSNTTSTIAISIKMILPLNIRQRTGPDFVWVNHGWIIPTLIQKKLSPSIQ